MIVLINENQLKYKSKIIEAINNVDEPTRIIVVGDVEDEDIPNIIHNRFNAILDILDYNRPDYQFKHIMREIRDKNDIINRFKVTSGLDVDEKLVFIVDSENIFKSIIKNDMKIEKEIMKIKEDIDGFSTIEYLEDIGNCDLNNQSQYLFAYIGD